MTQRGHEVTVCGAPGSPLADACRSSTTARFLPIDLGPKLGTRTIGEFLWRAPRHRSALLQVVLATGRPWDVVHLQYKKEQLLGTRALSRVGVRVVWTEHGGLPNGIRVNPAARRWYLFAARHTAAIGAVSRYVRQDLVEAGVPAAKLAVTYPGVRLERFRPAPEMREECRRSVRAALGWTEAATVIGLATRIAPGKGLPCLLQAFAWLADARTDARLLVVGSGPDLAKARQEVPERLRSRVAFVGFQVEVPRYLAAMDVFVSPTEDRTEGFPLRIIEAMAAGLPVVATRVAGQAEIVTHQHNGLLVPSGDPRALAHALAQLCDDPESRQTAAAAAAETASAFSEERYAEAHERLLLGKPGSPS